MEDSDDKKLRQALQNLNQYARQTKDIRVKVLEGNQQAMNSVQSIIRDILKDRSSKPVEKLLAIKLAKDCVQTFNDDFISQFQLTGLPLMEQIALFRRESKDDSRGRYFFGDQPDENTAKIANSFFRLTLECLWVWSKWFPIDPDTHQISQYRITFEKLIKLGVQFCKLEYFSYEEVEKNIPELMVPTKVLQECREVIQKDIKMNRGNPSPSRYIAEQLYSDIRKELAKAEQEPIDYAGKIKHALKKHSTSSMGDSKKSLSFSPWQPSYQHNQKSSNKIEFLPEQRIKTQSSLGQASNDINYQNLATQIQSLTQIVDKLQNQVGNQQTDKKQLQNCIVEQSSQITLLRQEIELQKEYIRSISSNQARGSVRLPTTRGGADGVKRDVLKSQIQQIAEARQNLNKMFGQSQPIKQPTVRLNNHMGGYR